MSSPIGSQTAWERWELAALDEGGSGPVHPLQAKVSVPDAPKANPEELEALRQAAYQEGYRQGFETGKQEGIPAGAAEGAAQGQAAAARLLTIAEKLDRSLDDLDAAVAEELTTLALAVAREVVRKSIVVAPESIITVVREALNLLPHQHASIYLHPDDASLLRNSAGEAINHAGHRIHEDLKLERGDVIIEAGGAHVDATVETRWRRVVETLGKGTPWRDGKR